MGSTNLILDFIPVGFRFRPTDEELVDHYLKHKLQGDHFTVHVIPEVELCKVEPWDIPASSVIKSDDPEWFFFSPRDYKYLNSKRCNRATNCGFWKATGKERYIRARRTNSVIGTKRTLVFYEGRVPNGVKTSWVIHEYHATTFDDDKRTFVLCRLMKKADKNAEGGTDAMLCDEGEPSSHMAFDYENQATAERIPNVCSDLPEVNMESIFQTLLESSIGIEQEGSFPISPSTDAYFRNENSSMQIQFETTEEEDNAEKFVNSILASVDEDVLITEERRDAFVNGSTRSESLRRVYYESSDTDAEVLSARYGYIVDTPTACNEHASSREYGAPKLAESSSLGAVRGGRRPISPNQEAQREKKDSIFQDNLWGVETSSCDSTADKPLEINCIEISSSPSTLRRWKNQYHSKPDNFVSQRASAKRSQTQRKVSSSAASHLEAKKVLPDVGSRKDQKKAQNKSSRKDLETRSHQSSDVNGKGSFIFLETPSSSESLLPRSVYLVNVVIGIGLFIFISWVLFSC